MPIETPQMIVKKEELFYMFNTTCNLMCLMLWYETLEDQEWFNEES